MIAIQEKMKVQTFVRVRHRFDGVRDKDENGGGMWDDREFNSGMRDENGRATPG